MTRERAKELLPVIQAYAEGKTVQYLVDHTSVWNNFTTGHEPCWSDDDTYRIKPTPTLRPWKPEEVPVGALVRGKIWHKQEVAMIISRDSDQFVAGGSDAYHWRFDEALTDCEHSLDHGKTWSPCGVMEDAQ